MIAAFREQVAQAMTSPAALDAELGQMERGDWQGVAELFAARLPEFDAVYAMPGAQDLALLVAQTRGVPVLTDETPISLLGEGEIIVLSAHLKDGEAEEKAMRALAQQGWRVLLVVTALEQTTRGARPRLAEQGVPVRAALQVAETPRGLVFERRSPERWIS